VFIALKQAFATSKRALNYGLPYCVGSRLKTIQYII